MKILLVEDDLMIAKSIQLALAATELHIEHVGSVKEATVAMRDNSVGLLILDLGLPDGDGLDMLGNMRKAGVQIPVLVLTARDEPRARVLGLDTGADDYLIKPFDVDELIARVRALFRRSLGRTAAIIEYDRLTLNPGEMSVYLDQEHIDIPLSHFRLLQYLLDSQGRVKTKQQIINALYRWDEYIEENTIEVYVSQLRKQLWSKLIKTKRGIGYVIPKLEDNATA